VIAIRRSDDGELCGFVAESGAGRWDALAVFGGRLGSFASGAEATAHVLEQGLASLALHWWYRPSHSDNWTVCCIQEARPGWVRVALDYYSMPGVPVVEVTSAALAAGHQLELEPPVG